MRGAAFLVRFSTLEAANRFVEEARRLGARAAMIVDTDRAYGVTLVGDPEAVEAALAKAGGATVHRIEPEDA